MPAIQINGIAYKMYKKLFSKPVLFSVQSTHYETPLSVNHVTARIARKKSVQNPQKKIKPTATLILRLEITISSCHVMLLNTR